MEIWNYFKSLFKTTAESSSAQPLIHEVIERNEAELADYQKWSKTLAKRRLLDWLHAQYAIHLSAPNGIDESLDFLNTPSAKGFVIHFDKTYYPEREVIHFFDYLKERVLAMGYVTYVSDLRTYTKNNKVETIQRHYLKPSMKTKFEKGGKATQAYGNIMIELLFLDETVQNLKFSAMTYTDHKFERAEAFEDLMSSLMSP